MILRRVAEHLKAQNWFAVGIDFVIVVVGVFIGIQVANWNEARRDRESEQQYLDRLREELSGILPQVRSMQARLADRLQRIQEVRDYLASGQGREALSDRHCAAVGTSHIYAGTIFYPPTIRELISTGRILLIRDPAVRTAILSFDQANADISQLRTDIQIDRRLLSRHHPELIDSALASDWAEARCDFEGMRHNPSFRNDFSDNMRRYAAYSADLGERQAEILGALAGAVGLELSSITPPPAATGGSPPSSPSPAGD